jgi:hypothetical protein
MTTAREGSVPGPDDRPPVAASGRTTNDFYEGVATVSLPGPTSIVVDGEVANPGPIAMASVPPRSVIVKQTVLRDGQPAFVGAYRFDGYALDDLLNLVVVRKRNEEQFPRIIDAYLEVSNDRGDTVILSWGELYYPVHRHEILIATRAMRIVPSLSKDMWPLPTETRLIVPSDLIGERNIPAPSRITVRSLDDPFRPAGASTQPLFSPDFSLAVHGRTVGRVTAIGTPTQMYPTVFYGRGRGLHGVTEFEGVPLKRLLQPHVPITRESLRRGLITAEGADGYRAAFSAAEILNRSDQSDVLVVDDERYEGRRFRLFPSSDYFSDRAVGLLSEIRYVQRG